MEQITSIDGDYLLTWPGIKTNLIALAYNPRAFKGPIPKWYRYIAFHETYNTNNFRLYNSIPNPITQHLNVITVNPAPNSHGQRIFIQMERTLDTLRRSLQKQAFHSQLERKVWPHSTKKFNDPYIH